MTLFEMTARFRSISKSIASKMLGREIYFFPTENRPIVFSAEPDTLYLLPLCYSYRASSEGTITYEFLEDGKDLEYELFELEFTDKFRGVNGLLCLSFSYPSVERGDTLRINITDSMAWLNSKLITSKAHYRSPGRKFNAQIRLQQGEKFFSRSCTHYLQYADKPIARDYYFGDDYSDYPKQTDINGALKLVNQFSLQGRLLEIGCALGIYTSAFLNMGFDAYGLDISEFAIQEAEKRIGSERVALCDLDESEIPFHGTFNVIWMWDVLEHSRDPYRLLQKVTRAASPDARLIIRTANANSLTHRLFGDDWEGFTDYSHYGIEQVSDKSLAHWLGELGWKQDFWECNSVWIEGVDPVLHRLREAFGRLPELKTLLSERNLGDLILVVATKNES